MVHEFLDAVEEELYRAEVKHGPHKSLHESYAIIREELDEFWDEVKQKHPEHQQLYDELIQIAAMATQAATNLKR